MQALNETLLPIVQTINGYLSDYVLIVLLLGAGLFFSFKTKFVQVRCFGEGIWKSHIVRKETGERYELLPGSCHRYRG